MSEVNTDPIGDIRKAINSAFAEHAGPPDHKVIIDRAIDFLPDFFRQPLQSAGDTIHSVNLPSIAMDVVVHAGVYCYGTPQTSCISDTRGLKDFQAGVDAVVAEIRKRLEQR